MMGGDIGVTSAPGKGSRFTVRLPFAAPPAGALRKLPQAVRADTGEQFARTKALLAEDFEMNVVVTRELLKRFFGIDPAIVRDGAAAVEMVKQGRFDIIFMDIHMPKMDGIRATKAIRKLGIATPIVGLSADALSSDIEIARKAGMNDYITKPVTRNSLLEVLTRYGKKGRPAPVPPIPALSRRRITRERLTNHFRERYIDDAPFVETLVRETCKALISIEAEAREGIERKDGRELCQVFHKLKGLLLQCGLEEESRTAEQLEESARQATAWKRIRLAADGLFEALKEFTREECHAEAGNP